MRPSPGHRAAYLSFDRFPSTKGAGVHIGHAARTLFDHFGGGLLGVLGGGGLPRYQRDGEVEIARFDQLVPNLIDRAEAYSAWVSAHLTPHLDTLELVQARDPWSALPAITLPGSHKLVYEANGLPSIELPHRWPAMPPAVVAILRELERHCLAAAHAVVVPSETIALAVAASGAPEHRITVVRNGADVPELPLPRPPDAPDRYLVYVGALQPWQGVDVLLRGFGRLADLPDLRLVICSSVPAKRARPLRRLAERLGLEHRVVWRFATPHHEVAQWLAGAEISVAPLTACARNVDQGCCPLKIIESMAVGVPVVASDLPAVRELVADGQHGRLVAPERPAELARALRVLLEYPDKARQMGRAGRARVVRELTWQRADDELAAVYRTVMAGGTAAGP